MRVCSIFTALARALREEITGWFNNVSLRI